MPCDFENLVAKASGILALQHLIRQNQLDPACIDYIIETSEEAIGDMNQRGGGNMAKAIGEVCEIVNASGIDMRGFVLLRPTVWLVQLPWFNPGFLKM